MARHQAGACVPANRRLVEEQVAQTVQDEPPVAQLDRLRCVRLDAGDDISARVAHGPEIGFLQRDRLGHVVARAVGFGVLDFGEDQVGLGLGRPDVVGDQIAVEPG